MKQVFVRPLPSALVLLAVCGTLGATACSANSTPQAPGLSVPPGEWRVVSIGATALPTDGSPTLEVADGRVFGHSGCNRYSGSLTINQERLLVGPLISTKMACAPDVMLAEQDLLNALQTVTTASVSEDGLLVLSGEDGPKLSARRG
jgi:putative lipoprotein